MGEGSEQQGERRRIREIRSVRKSVRRGMAEEMRGKGGKRRDGLYIQEGRSIL